MIEKIKTIILDFQESALETGVPRHLSVTPVKGKATVVTGVRRAGKSTFFHQIIRRLEDGGVSRRNILYLNFFDDRLHDVRRENLALIVEAYYSLFPEKKNTETVYCFFDEIQDVSGWEPFIDRLMRTENCEVYLTGSSARMLSTEIATQMRGRAISWEMFPFSFREFLSFKGVAADEPLSTKRQLLVRKAFDAYWENGGFPEVAGLAPRLRIKIHQEYFHAILFRDLVERHDIAHPRALSDLAFRLLDTVASLYSANSLTGHLRSLGHKVSKSLVSDYLGWFEDAFFLFTVRLFDASLARREANPKRIYCIDHALAASVASGILVNSGHLLENLVFAALRRVYPEIYYYKTRSGREVDFIVPSRGTSHRLVQVCESLADPRTRKREVAALAEAMAELKVQSGVIVARNDEEQMQVDAGLIAVTPAWKFLLELPSCED